MHNVNEDKYQDQPVICIKYVKLNHNKLEFNPNINDPFGYSSDIDMSNYLHFFYPGRGWIPINN